MGCVHKSIVISILHIIENLDKGFYTDVVFYMDICKAFDTIDHSKQLCNFDFKEFPIP